jgi:putative intracellular protease/amidase
MTAKTGFLDTLIASSFQVDGAGRTVFYPWGVFSRGVIVPTEALRDRLRALLKAHMFIGIPVVAICISVFGWLPAIAVAAVEVIAFWFFQSRLIKGLEASDHRLTTPRAIEKFASAASYWVLGFFAALSALFAAMGLYLVAIGDTTLGLASAVGFAAITALYLYALFVKATMPSSRR